MPGPGLWLKEKPRPSSISSSYTCLLARNKRICIRVRDRENFKL